ncbi:thermonuclease family protein [Paradevosia shaoguanensis]|uniref:thermonuclease family protein n=1 Tax=Paradevosia shaoguanensis TaxID=1335043 RepID=UPI003C71E277
MKLRTVAAGLTFGLIAGMGASAPAMAQPFASEPLFEETGTATVVDGDHLAINGRTIGLWGIDAPLPIQPCIKDGKEFACGRDAKDNLEKLVANQTVVCKEARDTENLRRRMLRWARCTVGDLDLSAEQARLGMAIALSDQSQDYVAQEAEAKAAKVGIWSADEFENPSDWEFRMKTQ